MPTYVDLAAEPWYLDEYEPPALARFNARLRAFYGHSKAQSGSKGDNRHLKGRHRSINWVLNSRFCTNRSYGTADMRDRRGPWDALRATDIGLTGATLRAASARLDAAVRGGRLLGLAEWFGTVDGTHVVGWYEGHTSSSDSSHLYHLHLGYWTEHTDDAELFDLLFETITGTPTGDDMLTDDDITRLLNADVTAITNAKSLANALWVARQNALAANQRLAGAAPVVIPKLDAILAAALDDGNTTVVLAPEALAELTAIRAQLATLPEATADAVVEEIAS